MDIKKKRFYQKKPREWARWVKETETIIQLHLLSWVLIKRSFKKLKRRFKRLRKSIKSRLILKKKKFKKNKILKKKKFKKKRFWRKKRFWKKTTLKKKLKKKKLKFYKKFFYINQKLEKIFIVIDLIRIFETFKTKAAFYDFFNNLLKLNVIREFFEKEKIQKKFWKKVYKNKIIEAKILKKKIVRFRQNEKKQKIRKYPTFEKNKNAEMDREKEKYKRGRESARNKTIQNFVKQKKLSAWVRQNFISEQNTLCEKEIKENDDKIKKKLDESLSTYKNDKNKTIAYQMFLKQSKSELEAKLDKYEKKQEIESKKKFDSFVKENKDLLKYKRNFVKWYKRFVNINRLKRSKLYKLYKIKKKKNISFKSYKKLFFLSLQQKKKIRLKKKLDKLREYWKFYSVLFKKRQLYLKNFKKQAKNKRFFLRTQFIKRFFIYTYFKFIGRRLKLNAMKFIFNYFQIFKLLTCFWNKNLIQLKKKFVTKNQIVWNWNRANYIKKIYKFSLKFKKRVYLKQVFKWFLWKRNKNVPNYIVPKKKIFKLVSYFKSQLKLNTNNWHIKYVKWAQLWHEQKYVIFKLWFKLLSWFTFFKSIIKTRKEIELNTNLTHKLFFYSKLKKYWNKSRRKFIWQRYQKTKLKSKYWNKFFWYSTSRLKNFNMCTITSHKNFFNKYLRKHLKRYANFKSKNFQFKLQNLLNNSKILKKRQREMNYTVWYAIGNMYARTYKNLNFTYKKKKITNTLKFRNFFLSLINYKKYWKFVLKRFNDNFVKKVFCTSLLIYKLFLINLTQKNWTLKKKKLNKLFIKSWFLKPLRSKNFITLQTIKFKQTKLFYLKNKLKTFKNFFTKKQSLKLFKIIFLSKQFNLKKFKRKNYKKKKKTFNLSKYYWQKYQHLYILFVKTYKKRRHWMYKKRYLFNKKFHPIWRQDLKNKIYVKKNWSRYFQLWEKNKKSLMRWLSVSIYKSSLFRFRKIFHYNTLKLPIFFKNNKWLKFWFRFFYYNRKIRKKHSGIFIKLILKYIFTQAFFFSTSCIAYKKKNKIISNKYKFWSRASIFFNFFYGQISSVSYSLNLAPTLTWAIYLIHTFGCNLISTLKT